MTLEVVLVILSFLHGLVMLPVPMEPLSIPHVSQRCPSLHVESILPMFSHHFPYALVQRKFILSQPFLGYLEFACWSFPVQLLVHAHLVHSSSSTLSNIAEYLVSNIAEYLVRAHLV